MKMPMKNLILFFIISLQSIANAQKVTITAHPDYAPVTHYNSVTNKFDGIAIELIETALKELGYEPEFIGSGAWARAQDQVKRGAIDILLPPYKTEERDTWMLFPKDAFMNDESAIFVSTKRKVNVSKLEDLAKYKGVAIINDSFGTEFDTLDKDHLKMTRVGSTELCFRMITNDRADYAVAGLHAGLKVMKDMQLQDDIRPLKVRAVTTGMFMGLSKKSKLADDPQFLIKLDKKVEELKDRGLLKKLVKKYSPQAI